MSTIQHVPTWARPDVDNFKATGRLQGQDVKHIPIPPEQVDAVELKLTQQIGQLIQADETPFDQAKGEPGKVKVEQMGLSATAHFEGDTKVGSVAMEASGPINTAAYGEFSAASANLVQIVQLDEGNFATVGAHIDRQNPAESYVELKNVPDGMVGF